MACRGASAEDIDKFPPRSDQFAEGSDALKKSWVGEFSRVCSVDGWVAFQVPARQSNSGLLPAVRKKLVDGLPFGLGRLYRNWRHGTAAVFEMYFTPVSVVLKTSSAVGLRLIHREPDKSAGEASEGYFYIFRKASSR